jgi:hypothetical protein
MAAPGFPFDAQGHAVMKRSRMRPFTLTLFVPCLFGVTISIEAGDSGFSLAAGAEYSTGEYGGTSSVDEVFVPVTLAWNSRRLSSWLTVPYLSVRAPEGTVVEGPDGQPVIGEGPVRTQDGLGDIVAGLTVYDVLQLAGGDFALDLTGKVKFGTADEEQGLGTGENDYSLQADMYRFFDRLTIMGSVGYVLRGDPPGVDLDDSVFASLGATTAVTERTRCGVFYDYRQASLSGSDDPQQLSATVSSRVASRGWIQGYLGAGFGDSAPDWTVGLSVSGGF